MKTLDDMPRTMIPYTATYTYETEQEVGVRQLVHAVIDLSKFDNPEPFSAIADKKEFLLWLENRMVELLVEKEQGDFTDSETGYQFIEVDVSNLTFTFDFKEFVNENYQDILECLITRIDLLFKMSSTKYYHNMPFLKMLLEESKNLYKEFE